MSRSFIRSLLIVGTEDLEQCFTELLIKLHWRILDDSELFRRYIVGMTALTVGRWGISGRNDVRKGFTTIVFKRLDGSCPSAAMGFGRNGKGDRRGSMDGLSRRMANRIRKEKDRLGLAEGDFVIGASYADRYWSSVIERL